ncbi:MAG: glycine cleavage system protein GcvH [Verrucomicrobiota bacterium]
MNIPENLRYAESHEWILVNNGIGTVGITDHAQHELSDVVFAELPKIGKVVKAKDPTAVVESVKAASDIYSPVSGEIVEVNQELTADPAKINSDAYGAWIFKVKLSNPAEVDALKDAKAYAAQIG